MIHGEGKDKGQRAIVSPGEMVHREKTEEMRKKFFEGIDKPQFPKKNDERFKI